MDCMIAYQIIAVLLAISFCFFELLSQHFHFYKTNRFLTNFIKFVLVLLTLLVFYYSLTPTIYIEGPQGWKAVC